MDAAPALTAIEAVTVAHRGGHRCTDGTWYNDNAGTRALCPTRRHLDAAADHVRVMGQRVHEAAHHEPTALLVGLAAAGYTADDLPRMHPDDQRGFVTMGRYAIETLSERLDQDTSPEARRAEAAAALIRERVGLPPRA